MPPNFAEETEIGKEIVHSIYEKIGELHHDVWDAIKESINAAWEEGYKAHEHSISQKDFTDRLKVFDDIIKKGGAIELP